MNMKTNKQQEDRIRKFCPDYESLLAYTMATEDSLNKLSEIYLLLNEYSIKGGFVQDSYENLCKEGDKIKCFDETNPLYNFTGTIYFSDEDFCFHVMPDNERYCSRFLCDNAFELVKPCEPDIISIIRKYEDNLLKENDYTDEDIENEGGTK